MENKQKTYIHYIGLVGIGLLAGWLFWGHRMDESHMGQQSHMMPDGTMMGDHMSMESMMDSMNAALKGKTGDAFDQAFLSEMIVHHQGAIDMAALAETNAKHQEIKDLAKEITTAQVAEIAQMKDWQKTWYNK